MLSLVDGNAQFICAHYNVLLTLALLANNFLTDDIEVHQFWGPRKSKSLTARLFGHVHKTFYLVNNIGPQKATRVSTTVKH